VDTLADVLHSAKGRRVQLSNAYEMVAERLGSDLKPADIPLIFSISEKLSTTLKQYTDRVRSCSTSIASFRGWLMFQCSFS
jgi:hypothetical protein